MRPETCETPCRIKTGFEEKFVFILMLPPRSVEDDKKHFMRDTKIVGDSMV